MSSFSLARLVLDESEDVAVEIDDRRHHSAATYFVRRVFDRGTSSSHFGELRFDVIDVPVRDRRRQALRSTARQQPDVLAGDIETEVEGLVSLGCDAEEGGIDRLGLLDVGHRMQHRLDSLDR